MFNVAASRPAQMTTGAQAIACAAGVVNVGSNARAPPSCDTLLALDAVARPFQGWGRGFLPLSAARGRNFRVGFELFQQLAAPFAGDWATCDGLCREPPKVRDRRNLEPEETTDG